jgi:hypothetical protein
MPIRRRRWNGYWRAHGESSLSCVRGVGVIHRKAPGTMDVAGFALPSVLLLVTILSFVAVSVIALQYFMRQMVFWDVARIKAEYAAESGIARTLNGVRSPSQLLSLPVSNHFSFADGSESQAEVRSWGLLLRLTSEGRFHNVSTRRSAILAGRPPSPFSKALLFANAAHQLVLTGRSSIEGNVVVGLPGVTIGTLRNLGTPAGIPIEGTIDKQQSPTLPAFQSELPARVIRMFLNLLSESASKDQGNGRTLRVGGNDGTIARGAIADSVDTVFVDGDLFFQDSIRRTDKPLYIAANGRVVLRSGCTLHGLIVVMSSSSMKIEKNADVDQGILFSRTSIELLEGADISAQLMAPTLRMDSSSRARYPSIAFSERFQESDTAQRQIILQDGAYFEGTVMLIDSTVVEPSKSLIVIQPAATVTGSIYSTTRIVLDGAVVGTVIATDFYFYDSPTAYLGWLRSGRIDRRKLSPAFLVPPVFSDELHLDILDWL